MGYRDTYDRWKADPEAYWLEQAEAIDWDIAPKQALFDRGDDLYEWFADASVNTCYNAVDRHVEDGRAAAGVAAAAVMMGLGAGASGCDVTGRKPVTDTGGAKPDSGPQPGVCAVKPDSGPQPGVCPVRPDGGPQPGVCAVRPDSGPQPGVCPVKPDGMIPGLCPPPQPDGGPQPGVCPIKPDQGKPKDRDGGPKPGVCPMPGIC